MLSTLNFCPLNVLLVIAHRPSDDRDMYARRDDHDDENDSPAEGNRKEDGSKDDNGDDDDISSVYVILRTSHSDLYSST